MRALGDVPWQRSSVRKTVAALSSRKQFKWSSLLSFLVKKEHTSAKSQELEAIAIRLEAIRLRLEAKSQQFASSRPDSSLTPQELRDLCRSTTEATGPDACKSAPGFKPEAESSCNKYVKTCSPVPTITYHKKQMFQKVCDCDCVHLG